jgi:putative tryptophan/tyrosine transport system substrate-binding protein
MFGMRRRDFVNLLGGAVAGWPLATRAQQTAMPVIGFLSPTSPNPSTERLRGLRQGLQESGYVEGEDVTIGYWLIYATRDPETGHHMTRSPSGRPL